MQFGERNNQQYCLVIKETHEGLNTPINIRSIKLLMLAVAQISSDYQLRTYVHRYI